MPLKIAQPEVEQAKICSGAQTIGDHRFDHPPGLLCGSRVVVNVRRQGDQRFPQRPASPSHPGRLIHRQIVEERLPALPLKKRPCDDRIASRVTRTRAAKINDCAQAVELIP